MRMPFITVAVIVLAGAIGSRGQVGSSPVQLLHPIMKDPNHRNAPTSLNQDPDGQQTADLKPQRPAPRPAAVQPVRPAQPAVIVAKIDAGLVASKITTVGTISGIKGAIYVTNVGAQAVTPVVRMAVCDQKGVKIGVTSKTGDELAPSAGEKIVVLATNLNATELHLLQLTTLAAK